MKTSFRKLSALLAFAPASDNNGATPDRALAAIQHKRANIPLAVGHRIKSTPLSYTFLKSLEMSERTCVACIK